VIGGLICLAGIAPFLHHLPTFYPDYLVYRAGGWAVLRGIGLYGPDFPKQAHTPFGLAFTYPPFAAMMFTLFAALPSRIGKDLDLLLGSVSFIGAAMIFAWCGLRGEIRRGVPRIMLPVCVCVGLLLEPMRKNYEMGQINTVLLLLVTADCLVPFERLPRYLRPPRGVLIGIAAAFKLTPLVFLLYFAVRRDWKALFTGIASFAVCTGIAFAVLPGNSVRYWLHTVANTDRIGVLAQAWNQSANGVLERLRLGTAEKPLWLLTAALLTVVGAIALHRSVRAGDLGLAFLVAAALEVLISPVSWSHHWVWAGLFVIWAVYRSWTSRHWFEPVALAAGIAIFWIGPHWLVPSDALAHPWTWQQHLIGNAYVWAAVAFLIAVASGWATRGKSPDVAPAPAAEPAPLADVGASAERQHQTWPPPAEIRRRRTLRTFFPSPF
jgi:alpha-1,2-mannosyltransferase